ncbi:MAG TPA: hypothetical protein VJX67_06415 [Blastocatellia bacterium]|nr:hypothetical protein [Blastocatellia bacterium]
MTKVGAIKVNAIRASAVSTIKVNKVNMIRFSAANGIKVNKVNMISFSAANGIKVNKVNVIRFSRGSGIKVNKVNMIRFSAASAIKVNEVNVIRLRKDRKGSEGSVTKEARDREGRKINKRSNGLRVRLQIQVRPRIWTSLPGSRTEPSLSSKMVS